MHIAITCGYIDERARVYLWEHFGVGAVARGAMGADEKTKRAARVGLRKARAAANRKHRGTTLTAKRAGLESMMRLIDTAIGALS